VVIFGGLWMVALLVVAGTRRLVADPASNGLYRFLEAALPPASLLLAVGLFFALAERLPVAIVARQTLLRYTGIVSVIALVWFGLRLVDAIAELAIARMQKRQRRQVVSVITLLRRTAKVLLLLFSGIGILDTFGIDVTTGIAALGIGGIALALGAQKTVENLVGSVTVIADRPAQVGDFVKVGDVLGTVEDVGIRSTRIRTGERTVVTIPNGDLSARQIENFAARDRFLFNPVIALDYRVSSAKLKEGIAIIREVLVDHEKIAEGARANLAKITERAFNVEVFSYIEVRDFDANVIVREELLLAIVERLEAAGIGLAFPAQTIVFAPEENAAPLSLRKGDD
jgi:MscS family membrane protein